MHRFWIFALCARASATAYPRQQSTAESPDSLYYGVSLFINEHSPGEPALDEPAPVEINKLKGLGHVHASRLSFDTAVAINVDVDAVECRAFLDLNGLVPCSAPFTARRPALLATSLGQVGSVLCYIVPV